jgi:hypothetical protein
VAHPSAQRQQAGAQAGVLGQPGALVGQPPAGGKVAQAVRGDRGHLHRLGPGTGQRPGGVGRRLVEPAGRQRHPGPPQPQRGRVVCRQRLVEQAQRGVVLEPRRRELGRVGQGVRGEHQIAAEPGVVRHVERVGSA